MSGSASRSLGLLLIGPLVLVGCESGGGGGGEEAARVEIVEPAEGSTVSGTEVPVVLETFGAQVEAADNRQTEGRGHHHIYLDQDVASASEPIAAGVDGIVHMGDGSEEYMFTGVTPGEHRLIAVFAYGDHTPIGEVRADTVTFTVGP
ncbi:MAG: DUF4399 domain-containing protein [Gemmatimonas sp.]|nr:DUF4399 domain-containing protein [Gemmatimonas sp.]